MKPHKNKILFEGHIGKRLEKDIDSQETGVAEMEVVSGKSDLTDAPHPPDTYICKHLDYCSVKYLKDNCRDYENCRVYRFYEKYPEWLGIGGRI